MSYQEIAKNMIDLLPENQMVFIINMLEGLAEMSGINVHPEFTPNAETLAAVAEANEMLQAGTGQQFEGSTDELFDMLLAED